jgi:hypothetical protein
VAQKQGVVEEGNQAGGEGGRLHTGHHSLQQFPLLNRHTSMTSGLYQLSLVIFLRESGDTSSFASYLVETK